MISDQHKSTINSTTPLSLDNEVMRVGFDQWMTRSKRTQIRAASLLTGLLYIVASQIDRFVAPSELLPLMMTVHLYILPPFLFLITLLTFKKSLSSLTLFLLAAAPIIAAAGNLLIASKIESPSMRLTEIYLILFWIFTVSGLRLRLATISALIIVLLTSVVTYLFFSLSQENFVMHCFWMSASFSFGFLGAYLLEKSNKKVFVKHEQLKELAVTDKLTGLYNRANLDKILQNELQLSQRYGHQFGLVIMDLDHFKKINDTYGHQAGDEALVETANLITEHLRSTDKAIRWGGEEFIIIYLNTAHEEVMALTEELRKKIESHIFKTVGTKTASFGVTLYNEGDTVDSIIKRADSALYSAKSNGRNRIEFL